MNTVRFNRICKTVALLFLLVTVGGRTALYEYRGLPQSMDFPQYYMGGLIALNGAWESMYPIPNPQSTENAGLFEDSTLRPRYRELAVQRGVSETAPRFIQPPPMALLLVWLALFPLKIAYFVWVLIMIFAAWGIALQSGKIYELSLGRATKFMGLLVLIVAISPQAHRWVRSGNISIAVGWLVGYATLELVRRDGPRAAAAMTVGFFAKYATALLAPLLVVLRRWRTISWGIVMFAALVILSLILMGTEPYRVFFTDIWPTLTRSNGISENQALYPTLLRVLGRDRPPLPGVVESSFSIAKVATILLILALIFFKPRGFWKIPQRVFAAALALMSWLLIFSPICWEHYHALLAPFWGWLAYQATRSWPRAVLAVLAIAMSYVPTSLVLHQIAGGKFRLPEPLFSHLLCAVAIQLSLSIWVLAEWHLREARSENY